MKPIQKAFEYYVEMGKKLEQEKQEHKRKTSICHTNLTVEDAKLDMEINRKLSREFDKRVTEEIMKKFSADKERKLSGDFRNSASNNSSGNTSRKTSVYHTPPQIISPCNSNNSSPLPPQCTETEIERLNNGHIPKGEEKNFNKVSSTIFIAVNDKRPTTNDENVKYFNHQCKSLEEKYPLAKNKIT